MRFRSNQKCFSEDDFASIGGRLQPHARNEGQGSVNFFPLPQQASSKGHHRGGHLRRNRRTRHFVDLLAGDPQFVALAQPEFWLVPGPAKALQFNRILAAAGYRCNVQESGVSCQSDTSGKGFTFSANGYTPQYTDVPANAP